MIRSLVLVALAFSFSDSLSGARGSAPTRPAGRSPASRRRFPILIRRCLRRLRNEFAPRARVSDQARGEVVQAGGSVDAGGQVIPSGAIPTNAVPRPLAKDRSAPPNPPHPPLRPSTTPGHVAEIKKLVEAAAAKWKTVNCYEATVTRRELAPNKKMTEDVVLYQFRKEPMAVYMKNLGESGRGREILYFPSKHDDKIYSIIGKGDENFLLKVGDARRRCRRTCRS